MCNGTLFTIEKISAQDCVMTWIGIVTDKPVFRGHSIKGSIMITFLKHAVTVLVSLDLKYSENEPVLRAALPKAANFCPLG